MRREIPLTRGYVAIVDAKDYERVSQFKWHALVCHHTVYARRQIRQSNGKQIGQLMHRFILGITDPTILADHEDRNGLHNFRGNLRIATRSQNAANQRKRADGSSRFRGVAWYKRGRKWIAFIGRNGKQTHLGYFPDEFSAALAYDAAARDHFGEFANCNFPPKKDSDSVSLPSVRAGKRSA